MVDAREQMRVGRWYKIELPSTYVKYKPKAENSIMESVILRLVKKYRYFGLFRSRNGWAEAFTWPDLEKNATEDRENGR